MATKYEYEFYQPEGNWKNKKLSGNTMRVLIYTHTYQHAKKLCTSFIIYCQIKKYKTTLTEEPREVFRVLQPQLNCICKFTNFKTLFLGTCSYANAENVLALNLLPVKERIEFNIAKLTYKAIYLKNWPSYLSVREVRQVRVLRSNNDGKKLEIPKMNDTFEHLAALIFNSFPQDIRDCITYHEYVKKTRTVLMERAQARIL